MEVEGASSSTHSYSSLERLVAILLALIAILSPLFIDRRRTWYELEDESSGIDILSIVSTWLTVIIVALMVVVAVSLHLDRRFTDFDQYWIHRVGGSSGGIIVVLIVLFFVLKCRATAVVADQI